MIRFNRTRFRGIEKRSPVYFITFVTWSRLELNLAARKIVLDSCLFFNEQRYRIYAVVIMLDNVHLLIQPFIKKNINSSASVSLADQLNKNLASQSDKNLAFPSNKNLVSQSNNDINLHQNQIEYWSIGSILHSIKSYIAKQIPNVMNHISKVWQDGRHDRRIRNQQELDIKWEYIRQNPVKANLVTKVEDYPFLWEIF